MDSVIDLKGHIDDIYEYNIRKKRFSLKDTKVVLSVFRDNKDYKDTKTPRLLSGLSNLVTNFGKTPKPSQSHPKAISKPPKATSKTPKDLQTTQSPLKALSKPLQRYMPEILVK